jgi:hypothetical protein
MFSDAGTPPPNPLPQGEGENLLILAPYIPDVS